MVEDKWEKYRNMTRDELQAALDSGDDDAAEYAYQEYEGDDVRNPLEDDIYRNSLKERGYTDEEIEEEMNEDDED